jgi:hypothetical protein
MTKFWQGLGLIRGRHKAQAFQTNVCFSEIEQPFINRTLAFRPAWSRDSIQSAGRRKAPKPETHEESQGLWGFRTITGTRHSLGKECTTFHNRQPVVDCSTFKLSGKSEGWARNSSLIKVIKVFASQCHRFDIIAGIP